MIITAVILLQLTSCKTTKEIQYVSVITEEDIPEFPVLNYYAESADGNYVTVDSFWFQLIARYKLRINDLREVLRRTEELENFKK